MLLRTTCEAEFGPVCALSCISDDSFDEARGRGWGNENEGRRGTHVRAMVNRPILVHTNWFLTELCPRQRRRCKDQKQNMGAGGWDGAGVRRRRRR